VTHDVLAGAAMTAPDDRPRGLPKGERSSVLRLSAA